MDNISMILLCIGLILGACGDANRNDQIKQLRNQVERLERRSTCKH